MATNLYLENYVPAMKDARALETKLPITTVGTTANVTVGGNLTVAGTTTNTGGKITNVVPSSGATVALTASGTGNTYLFDRASGVAYTLPAAAVGLEFTFITTVLQTSLANAVTASPLFLFGSIAMFSGENVTPSATLGPKQFAGNGSSHVQVTTNATTTGGGIGTWLKFVCVATTGAAWYVTGVVNSPSGTIATPFST